MKKVTIIMMVIMALCANVVWAQGRQSLQSTFNSRNNYDVYMGAANGQTLVIENVKITDLEIVGGKEFIRCNRQSPGVGDDSFVAVSAIQAIVTRSAPLKKL